MENAERTPGYADEVARQRTKVQRRLALSREQEVPTPAVQRADQASPDTPDLLLEMAVEELQVAEEELRAQAEELVAAREKVEAEREQYRHLFEFAPVGYMVTDEHGMIREANRAAVRMLNISPQFLRGKPLALFVAAEERGAFRRALGRILSAGDVQEWPFRVQPRRAAAVEVTMTVEAVRDRSGAMRLYWIIRDDSERLEGDLL
jgi:PAS domain S-box-containing protein